ncbi:MAG TPA: hypothetical protein VGK32_14940 [Vicinamibacterales bacterium]
MPNGLDTHLRTRALLAGVHARADFAATPEPPSAPVIALPTPPLWPSRDGVRRGFVAAAMDAQNRISVTKLAPFLPWDDDTAVVVRIEHGKVRVTAGWANGPTELVSRFRDGRLTLPASARAVLDIGPGDVVVAATAGDGEVFLAAGADLALLMTGVRAAEPVAAASPEPAKRRKRSGVRPAWTAASAASG